MTKHNGFKIRIDAFVEIDKKDFAKQRDAYALMASIKDTNTLPDDFFATAQIVSIDAKQGSVDLPDNTDTAETSPAGKKPKPNPDGSSD